MARDYSPLLVAVLICVMLTGTAVVYSLLMSGAGPHEQPVSEAVPAPTRTGTPVTTGASVPGSPRSFSISVTPTATTVRPGDAVRFTLTVHPDDGFAAPVQIEVSATALGGVYRDSRDLAVLSPPYPPLKYEFAVPDLPPLVSTATVDATVTASGGGIVRTEQVQLVIRR